MARGRTHTDFLVVGSGLAGLTYALQAAESGSVTILTKAGVTDSNTGWAQGGIAAAIGEADSWELHEQDTLTAGAGLCRPEAVRALVQAAPDCIRWLQSLGVRFDFNDLKDLDLGREGGHSRARIVHHQDRTGWEVERALAAAVAAHPRITVYEHAFVTSLVIDSGRCVGVSARINDLGPREFVARATMLATGGCGKIYGHTTNPRVATGDGLGLALRVGLTVADMEFMQFHPTVLSHEQSGGFLITEAVRGAGATLRNHEGRRFMYDYDERRELAPRDIVARSIGRELHRLKTWCVYLDATHLPAERLHHEFPMIWDRLRELGIEMEKTWIPVVPAQHYSCGGIVTDLDGRTEMPGLYAAGEVASTGVHGANRLASNSLLEAMVFAKAAARASKDEPAPDAEAGVAAPEPECLPEPEAIRRRHALQRLMNAHCGIFRTDAGLREAQAGMAKLRREMEAAPKSGFSPYSFEAWNLLAAAESVAAGAIARRTNVGLHFNEDLAQSAGTESPEPGT